MLLPNAENATVDIGKLTNYLLDPEHESGKHKCRMFAAALNFKAVDSEALRTALLAAVNHNAAIFGKFDRYGQRYTVDFSFEWKGKSAIIRSGWIIEHGSDIPRLTTCYPR